MAKIFGKLQLPTNYAESLLEAEIEMELSETIKPEVVMRLVELYAKGMEYYESIRSYKYLYFQRMMNRYVKSATIIEEINQQKQKLKSSKELQGQMTESKQTSVQLSQKECEPILNQNQVENSRRLQQLEIKVKREKIHNEIVQSLYRTSDQMKTLLTESEDKRISAEERIKGQLNEQEKILLMKLEERKGRMRKTNNEMMEKKSTSDSLFGDESEEDWERCEGIEYAMDDLEVGEGEEEGEGERQSGVRSYFEERICKTKKAMPADFTADIVEEDEKQEIVVMEKEEIKQ